MRHTWSVSRVPFSSFPLISRPARFGSLRFLLRASREHTCRLHAAFGQPHRPSSFEKIETSPTIPDIYRVPCPRQLVANPSPFSKIKQCPLVVSTMLLLLRLQEITTVRSTPGENLI